MVYRMQNIEKSRSVRIRIVGGKSSIKKFRKMKSEDGKGKNERRKKKPRIRIKKQNNGKYFREQERKMWKKGGKKGYRQREEERRWRKVIVS